MTAEIPVLDERTTTPARRHRLLTPAFALVALLLAAPPLTAQTAETVAIPDTRPLLELGMQLAEQVPPQPQAPPATKPSAQFVTGSKGTIDYAGLLADSFTMLTIQHTFRIAAEAKTRRALKGPFWEDYFEALSIWRGWDDDDMFRVNYFGHPAMGAFSAFVFANNDEVSKNTNFGEPGYGRAKWRQFLFANVYSLQFELGPYSEASIGNVDQALIDHILTPTVGIAWSSVEDMIDAKLLAKLRRNHKNWANVLASFITPMHALANVAGFKHPWYREKPLVR
jgi:hypothetical protein